MTDNVPRPQFCIDRGGGLVTPLVAVDELPKFLSIRDVPVSLTKEVANALGIRSVGAFAKPEKTYVVERGDSDDTAISTAAAWRPTPAHPLGNLLKESETRSHGLAGDSSMTIEHGSTSPEASQNSTSKPSTLFQGPITTPFRPTPPSGLEPNYGKKTHCSHWISRGECSFTQQGCVYKHEMPHSAEELSTLGFSMRPRWWQAFLAAGSPEAKKWETDHRKWVKEHEKPDAASRSRASVVGAHPTSRPVDTRAQSFSQHMSRRFHDQGKGTQSRLLPNPHNNRPLSSPALKASKYADASDGPKKEEQNLIELFGDNGGSKHPVLMPQSSQSLRNASVNGTSSAHPVPASALRAGADASKSVNAATESQPERDDKDLLGGTTINSTAEPFQRVRPLIKRFQYPEPPEERTIPIERMTMRPSRSPLRNKGSETPLSTSDSSSGQSTDDTELTIKGVDQGSKATEQADANRLREILLQKSKKLDKNANLSHPAEALSQRSKSGRKTGNDAKQTEAEKLVAQLQQLGWRPASPNETVDETDADSTEPLKGSKSSRRSRRGGRRSRGKGSKTDANKDLAKVLEQLMKVQKESKK